jgi:hypothetical protein
MVYTLRLRTSTTKFDCTPIMMLYRKSRTLQLKRSATSFSIVGLRFSLDRRYIVAVDSEMYHIYSVTGAHIQSGTKSKSRTWCGLL